MKNKQKTDISQSTTVSHELFGFIPLFSITQDGELTVYKIIGLPVWIVQRIINRRDKTMFSRYYLFGFPVAETDLDLSENDDNTAETEKYFDIES